MDRIERFLAESDDITKNKPSESSNWRQRANQFGFHNILLAWHSEDRDCFKIRIDETLQFREGGLNVVVGQT